MINIIRNFEYSFVIGSTKLCMIENVRIVFMYHLYYIHKFSNLFYIFKV